VEHELECCGHYKRVLVIGATRTTKTPSCSTILVAAKAPKSRTFAQSGEAGKTPSFPELGEALGLLRSEELLAARRLDGRG